MKYINLFLACVWLIALIALFFGFEPNKITVGCAFFICVSSQLGIFLESKEIR